MNNEKFNFYAFWLAGVCIVVFILQILFSGFTEMFVLTQDYSQIWRFLTAIFLHGSLIHLVYNIFALVLFGSIVERLAGGKKFLIIFFASGIFANIVSAMFYPSSLGASGAIFGIIGALVLIRPGMTVWAFGLPMPMILAGILWATGDLLGAYGYLAGNPIDNTGNIAHIAGMFIGIIFGFFLREKRTNVVDDKLRLNEDYMRSWEDNYLR